LESFCGPHQTWIITDTVEVEFLLPFLSPSLCAPYNLIKAAVERATKIFFFFSVVTRKLSLSVFIGKRKENLNLSGKRICVLVARALPGIFFHFGRVVKGANYLNQYDPLKNEERARAAHIYICYAV
jgi:hypothetical protein